MAFCKISTISEPASSPPPLEPLPLVRSIPITTETEEPTPTKYRASKLKTNFSVTSLETKVIPTEPTEQQQQQQQLFPFLSSTPLRSEELSLRDLEEKTKEEDDIMSLWDSRASQVTSNMSQYYKNIKVSLKHIHNAFSYHYYCKLVETFHVASECNTAVYFS